MKSTKGYVKLLTKEVHDLARLGLQILKVGEDADNRVTTGIGRHTLNCLVNQFEIQEGAISDALDWAKKYRLEIPDSLRDCFEPKNKVSKNHKQYLGLDHDERHRLRKFENAQIIRTVASEEGIDLSVYGTSLLVNGFPSEPSSFILELKRKTADAEAAKRRKARANAKSDLEWAKKAVATDTVASRVKRAAEVPKLTRMLAESERQKTIGRETLEQAQEENQKLADLVQMYRQDRETWKTNESAEAYKRSNELLRAEMQQKDIVIAESFRVNNILLGMVEEERDKGHIDGDDILRRLYGDELQTDSRSGEVGQADVSLGESGGTEDEAGGSAGGSRVLEGSHGTDRANDHGRAASTDAA